MRLNGSGLNRRRLNAGRRLPVCGSGQTVVSIASEISATRIAHGTGDAIQRLDGEFLASAMRYAAGTWAGGIEAELAQTVVRSGRGHALLELGADLFYSRTVLGAGTAVFGLQLQGHVGVVFIDGQATIRPMQMELDAARVVMGQGAAAVGMGGALAPSAIRQIVAELVPVEMDGTLEGSHIDANGVRYIGFAGAAPLGLKALDAGMLRQAFIGSLDFELQGSGSGSLIKPTLAGEAFLGLKMAGDFHVIRPIHGQILLQINAEAEGNVTVFGDGRAVLSMLAHCTGYKRTYPGLEATLVNIDSGLEGTRGVRGDGSAVISLGMSSTGVRRRVGRSLAVIELLGESDSYLNPNAEDPTEETFSRLALPRDFSRPATAREWRR